MRESYKKMKRMKPLIGLSKRELDKQSGLLNLIISEKRKMLELLQEKQASYLKGTNKLNELRASNDRLGLLTLENSLDHLRSQWMDCLRNVKLLEQKEEAQRVEVHKAQVKMKSMEHLEDTYARAFKAKLGEVEQKEMDEIAIQRFSRNG